MNKWIEDWLDSIVLNGADSPSSKMYKIGAILSYEIEDGKIYREYYNYYENLVWSQVQSIETFDYDNYHLPNISDKEEKSAW